MKKMFHQFVSVVLAVALAMGAVVSAASAASLSYADHLLAGQTYSTAQETAIRGGIEKAPENIVSFLVREGLSLETEEECPGFGKASGACAVTSGTVVYVYDNAVEKNVVHEMGHVYANVLGLNPRALFAAYRDQLADLLPAHGLESAAEFWADCFSYFVLDMDNARSIISQKAPAMAALIQQVIALDGDLFTEGNLEEMNIFQDITADSSYGPAVIEAMLRGIVSGKTAATFDPDAQVTRAEGIQAVYGLENQAHVSSSFIPADVDEDAWYAESAAWASKYEAITKQQRTVYGADQIMTKAELVKAMHAFAICNGDSSKGGSVDLKVFSDVKDIPNGYKADIRWAISAGLITDNGDGILAPNSPITRVEMAVMLLHLVQYVEGIA